MKELTKLTAQEAAQFIANGETVACPAGQFRQEVAGPRPHVEATSANRGGNELNDMPSPALIKAKSHDPVHPVVAGGDTRKHPLDVAGFLFRWW